MKPTFFIFPLIIFIILFIYVLTRGAQSLSYVPTLKITYLILMPILLILFFTGMIFPNAFSLPVAKIITFIGYSFLVLFVYLLFSLLVTDIILIINRLIHFITATEKFRFRFFTMSFIAILGIMVYGNYQFNHPKIVHFSIKSAKPKQNKEVKIVVISDVHLGVSIDKNRLKKYVEMINNQHPDIVLIAGDLIDRSIVPVMKQKMDEELRMIKAPLGVYAIFGNHEYYGENMDYTKDFEQRANIHLLKDSITLVDNQFYIAGRDDKTNHSRQELKEILQHIDKSKPIIVLDHQPYHLEKTELNNVDLQISGHTHNGQFFPGNLFVKRMFENGYGYLKKGNTHFYTSSGLGLWGPQYRIGSQSELAVIDFKY